MRTVFRLFTAFALLLLSAHAFSQTTGYSGTGGNIDIKYYKCEWTINPGASTKNIAGKVTIRFKTVQANVSKITLDLNNTSFNNASLSVTYHGTTCGKSFSGNILTVTLPSTITAIGTLDEIVVSYSGAPPAVSGEAEGYQKKMVNSKNMIYTLSESYEDRDWWPCKADMQDKADSLDIYITTPSTYTAAANGVLISTTPSGGNRTFYYKHRHPIASYLVAVAVSEYTINSRGTVNINGTNMPVDYYYLSNRTPSATTLQTMDRCKDELVAFSSNSIFGDYPFKDEKYGMYEFGWGGGMEHQTFSAMGWGSMTNWGVIAHELGHQWWGDKVTFSTWHHLWLAEGFARYCESLAAELVPALNQNPASVRSEFKSIARTKADDANYAPHGCVFPNDSIINSTTLWRSPYGTTCYERGAMVVSMLRKLMGDAKFFQACRNYLNDPALAYKSATTDDLKRHFETVLGYDLDPFFNDYVFGGGYPTYTVNWGNNGTRVNIELTSQAKNYAGSTTYFHTPVVLRITNGLSGASRKDTTIVIYDENGKLSYAGNGIQATRTGKVLGYRLSFVPASVSFDPDNETLASGSVAKNSTLNNLNLVLLPVNIVDFKGTQQDNGNLLSLLIDPSSDQKSLTLERSENGTHFYPIGEMDNSANTREGINFTYLDKNVFDKPVYYYRVKTMDAGSVVNYSKIISIARRRRETSMQIFPNPARSNVRLSLPKDWGDRAVGYIIYNSNGVIIKREGNKKRSGEFNVFIGNLLTGNYTIELINGEGEKITKGFTVIH